LVALPAADALEILLPACRVSVHRLELPQQAGKHLDALIRQALEDRLLGDRSDALALPGRVRGTEREVWVCSRRWLESALERLTRADRYAHRFVTEYALLPEDEDATTYAVTSGGTIFRTRAGAFGIVGNEAALTRLAGGETLCRIEALAQRPSPPDASDERMGLPPALARFARRRLDPRSWRRVAMLLVAACALALLGAIAHWRDLENRVARLHHEIRQTFAATFPGTPIIDPILQWESMQRASAPRDDALDAAIRLANRLDIPIRPRGIEVGNEGGVRLTLTDSDAAQFDAQLAAIGKAEKMPAGAGFTQLIYRFAQEP
jgi:type II secretory pathway component PulL